MKLGAFWLLGAALMLGGCNPSRKPAPDSVAGGTSTRDWSKAPDTAEERLCARFIQLKNSGDPAALELLGPPPGVPDAPITTEEADRLDTDFFLRQDASILGVGRGQRSGTLMLYVKGSVSAPTFSVQTATGVQTHQRVMFNPDLTVEVRDGQIHGVASTVHVGP
jgi:hypothetical protein